MRSRISRTFLESANEGFKWSLPIKRSIDFAIRFPLHQRRNTIERTKNRTCQRATVLGIESSCDDTGVAIVDHSGTILAEKLVSQTEIHSQWGGVVPNLAKRAHQEAIEGLIEKVLYSSKISSNINAVAVTVGPGLSLCLRVGVEAAMKISEEKRIPLIPIHHMEAHALVGRMQQRTNFPFLCLLISGGHNLLLIVHAIGIYTQIGTTIDDSLGEAYDKVARMLGLKPFPSGGAALEATAKNGDSSRFTFKLPMQKYKNCDFSFSGLKTAVRLSIEKAEMDGSLSDQIQADIAASFQKVAIQHLEDKCRRGILWARKEISDLSPNFVVAGGVASNLYVRERLRNVVDEFKMELVCPPPRLCTDNGVMVAWAGMERFEAGLVYECLSESVEKSEWIDVRPRWPLTDRRAFENQNKRIPERKRLYTSLTAMTEQRLPTLTSLSTSDWR